MIIREPLVQATYYYLHEAPGDSAARREDRYDLFVEDAQRVLATVCGWLAMPVPALPALQPANGPARHVLPLMQTGELHGHTNAAASLHAYALRNMLLLRVVLSRPGDHEHTVWTMLDESLGENPTTPTWLHTARYWCGVAQHLPEALEAQLSAPMRTDFGVLSVAEDRPHLLIYPDARAEARAAQYLGTLAPRLDWYPVQARYSMDRYTSHVASAARSQQSTLDRVAQSMQGWTADNRRSRLRSLDPLHEEISALESAHQAALRDLDVTQHAANDLGRLVEDYRLALMESGLWDAAPTVWAARAGQLAGLHAQVEADVHTVDATLRRIEMMMQAAQTRVLVLQSERDRWMAYLLAAFGLAIVLLLVVSGSLLEIALRVVLLAAVAGGLWFAWQRWQRTHGGDGAAGP